MPDTFVSPVGNLTDDPRAALHPQRRRGRQLPPGRHPPRQGRRGWRDGETSFFRVNAWRDLAEHATESLTKGTRVVVLGRLKARSWETPEGSAARWWRSRPRRSRPR
jgi:single-strand DNA-binding protein